MCPDLGCVLFPCCLLLVGEASPSLQGSSTPISLSVRPNHVTGHEESLTFLGKLEECV